MSDVIEKIEAELALQELIAAIREQPKGAETLIKMEGLAAQIMGPHLAQGEAGLVFLGYLALKITSYIESNT